MHWIKTTIKYGFILLAMAIAPITPKTTSHEFPVSWVEYDDIVAEDVETVNAPAYLNAFRDENKLSRWRYVNNWVLNNAVIMPEVENHDVLCMAMNVYHEARGSNLEDKIAVTEVVLNRAMDTRWPNGICDVVWQNWQFSWTMDDLTDMPYEDEAWIEAQTVASMVYKGYTYNLLDGHDHYHTLMVNPQWSKYGEDILELGQHLYMKVSL